jgi:hypothetical protein
VPSVFFFKADCTCICMNGMLIEKLMTQKVAGTCYYGLRYFGFRIKAVKKFQFQIKSARKLIALPQYNWFSGQNVDSLNIWVHGQNVPVYPNAQSRKHYLYILMYVQM